MGWLIPTAGISWTDAGAGQAASELATRFQATLACQITQVAWYRSIATADRKPSRLFVYLVGSTSSPVWSTTTYNDSGQIGWQVTPVSPPIDITADTAYIAGADWPSGGHFPQVAQSGAGAAGDPWRYDAPLRYYCVSCSNVYPTTTDSAFLMGVNVYTPTTGGGLVATPTIVDNLLSSWLRDDNENSHQDTSTTPGLPWTIKQAVDNARAVIDNIKSVTDLLGNASAGAIEKLNRWSDAGIDALNKASDLANNWPTLLNDRIFGTTSAGGSAFTGIGSAITGLTSDIGSGAALLREWLTLSPDLTDSSRWTLVSTTTGSGDGLVEVQADLFVVSLTVIPFGLASVVVGEVSWTPKWGWTAPRVHGSYRERQFNDLGDQAVTANGLFMDGLLVSARPGVEWVVKAYVLDRS